VDEHGRLRIPQSAAPHLYKQSPLGWIPKEWEVERYGDAGDKCGGFTLPEAELPLILECRVRLGTRRAQKQEGGSR